MTAFQSLRVGTFRRERFPAEALAAVVCLVMALLACPAANVAGPNSGGTPPATAALVPVPGSPFAAAAYPFSVAVDPTGKFVYVANAGNDNVSVYSLGSNGALTESGFPFAAGSAPFSETVDPTGKFVYVANSLGSNDVSAYTIH